MGVAAGDAVVIVIGIRKMQISGYKPRDESKRAQRCNHEPCKVATAPARELQRLDRGLDSLLMSRRVLEGCLDVLRHIDEKFAGVGRSILTKELGCPESQPGVRGQACYEASKAWPVFS